MISSLCSSQGLIDALTSRAMNIQPKIAGMLPTCNGCAARTWIKPSLPPIPNSSRGNSGHEWRASFTAFYRDMGPRPTSGHSLERKNTLLGYSKDNCCWATLDVQNTNYRSSRWWIVKGVVYGSSTEAGEALGVWNSTIHRMCLGRSAGLKKFKPPAPGCY